MAPAEQALPKTDETSVVDQLRAEVAQLGKELHGLMGAMVQQAEEAAEQAPSPAPVASHDATTMKAKLVASLRDYALVRDDKDIGLSCLYVEEDPGTHLDMSRSIVSEAMMFVTRRLQKDLEVSLEASVMADNTTAWRAEELLRSTALLTDFAHYLYARATGQTADAATGGAVEARTLKTRLLAHLRELVVGSSDGAKVALALVNLDDDDGKYLDGTVSCVGDVLLAVTERIEGEARLMLDQSEEAPGRIFVRSQWMRQEAAALEEAAAYLECVAREKEAAALGQGEGS